MDVLCICIKVQLGHNDNMFEIGCGIEINLQNFHINFKLLLDKDTVTVVHSSLGAPMQKKKESRSKQN